MKSIFTCFIFVFINLIIGVDIIAQNTTAKEFDLNKNDPGANYKFSYVHITDIHIGEGQGDYGTPGFFNDTMPTVDNSYAAVRLRKAVQWINQHAQEKNIKFVVISGDMTDSGEKSEFQMSKKILDELTIPYVPLIGNHDIWPYVRYQNEAPYACGDSVMNEVFADVYESNRLFFDNWNDGTRLQRIYNPESSHEHYLQNLSFEYDGFVFYALDFNPRYHVNKAEPGIGPEAQLMDWTNGTFRWWKNELQNNTHLRNKNVCFFSHHPATNNLLFVLSGFVFDFDEYNKIINMLTPYKQHLALWMTGHIHLDYDYYLTNNIMRVRGMAANKEFDSAHFQIVNVYDIATATPVLSNTKTQQVEIFPNPSNGRFTVATELFNPSTIISLYDITGAMVLQKNIATYKKDDFYEMDFSYLPKGTYILSIANKEFTKSERLVLQ